VEQLVPEPPVRRRRVPGHRLQRVCAQKEVSMIFCFKKFALGWGQGCHIFLDTRFQNAKKYTK
jgi:hypothetical protein